MRWVGRIAFAAILLISVSLQARAAPGDSFTFYIDPGFPAGGVDFRGSVEDWPFPTNLLVDEIAGGRMQIPRFFLPDMPLNTGDPEDVFRFRSIVPGPGPSTGRATRDEFFDVLADLPDGSGNITTDSFEIRIERFFDGNVIQMTDIEMVLTTGNVMENIMTNPYCGFASVNVTGSPLASPLPGGGAVTLVGAKCVDPFFEVNEAVIIRMSGDLVETPPVPLLPGRGQAFAVFLAGALLWIRGARRAYRPVGA